jgi:flagellum-specific ATP synthase
MNEPVADAVRAILDGHVVLSRELAHAGHYPAIDILQSVSRLVGEVVSPEVRNAGQELRRLLAALRDKGDLISIGAYQPGSDPVVDTALAKREAIERFLQQTVDYSSTAEEADAGLLALVADAFIDDGAGYELEPGDEGLPGVAPGETAIPPLHLAV